MEQLVTLSTLGNGAVAEQFAVALEETLKNIQDPNTDAKAARGITIIVKIKPAPDRSQAQVDIEVKTKLAPQQPLGTTMFMSFSAAGITATEYNLTQPGLFEGGEEGEKNNLRIVKEGRHA